MSKGPARIIIEGTEYAHTKGISLALSEYPPFIGQKGDHRYTAVISVQWGNYKDFPWGAGLVDFDPSQETQAMNNYGVWVRLIEMQRLYHWIIDRFHITTQGFQLQTHDHVCDFTWLEERLLKLGFHLIHLVQNEGAIQQSISSRTDVNGRITTATVLQAQETAQAIVSKSILPKYELDISDLTIPEAVTSITDWYEEVSPYSSPDHQEPDKIFLPSCS